MRLPYFDFIFDRLAAEDATVATTFGRHVHWGYWPDPRSAQLDDADFARAAEQLTLELCRLAEICDGQHVLDAGCGFGGTLASIDERHCDMRLVGLNIDAAQLGRAAIQVRASQGNQIAFCRGDACSLPFADESIDRLLAVECVFHFPSRDRFFAEARRVLKPGGILALSDFLPQAKSRDHVKAITSTRWFRERNYFGSCDITFSLDDYRRLAAENGLVTHAERNATGHVQPTYRFVSGRLGKMAKAGLVSKKALWLIRLLRLIAKLEVLHYYLLAYRKPSYSG